MILLASLKPARVVKSISPAQLADVTGLDPRRVRDLELRAGSTCEPWFHEAALLSRALCVQGILPLTLYTTLDEIDLGNAMPVELEMFRSGMRLSLTTACRVARSFGLSDPLHLVEVPPSLLAQIWDVLGTNERLSTRTLGLGTTCPWCLARPDAGGGNVPHLSSCLPNNLFSPRARDLAPNVTMPVPPRQRGKGALPGGHARGLAAFRHAQGLTQADMSVHLGLTNTNYYSRIERCEDRLSVERATLLANAFGVDRAIFYRDPRAGEEPEEPGTTRPAHSEKGA